jgi:hypothetical protein
MLLALLAALPWASSSQAEGRRVALVVGNSAYQLTPRLDNPRNDASDVAAALGKLGFRVIAGTDLDKAAFDRKVRDFAVALRGADAGVLFYAGHGLQVDGHNYLVPVDAKAEEAAALDLEMAGTDGAPVRYHGTFRGKTGSGTWSREDGKCGGTFTATRD